ncbi:hypothetical protein M9435_003280 [Picochlorum sp. BPE23]|nr:hypothetical protein M9435_003280 [Picochlorum sp. BPE23]
MLRGSATFLVFWAICLSLVASLQATADFDPRFAASRSLKRVDDEELLAVSSVNNTAVDALATSGLCRAGYDLVWHDDFESSKSLNDWSYLLYNGCEYGICGWGNNELEYYTNSTRNVRVSNGSLKIIARKASDDDRKTCCPSGTCKKGECEFTSGKVRTFNKFAVRPSWSSGSRTIRIDARIKMPVGQGLWPSFTLLPEDSPEFCLGCGYYGDWPQSGAITLSQKVNKDKEYTGGILYGGVAPDIVASTFSKKISDNLEGFHTYTLEWKPTSMKWKLDGKTVFKAKSGKGNPEKGWFSLSDKSEKNSPFDKPFYLVVGMALGGDQTGASPNQVRKTLKNKKSMEIQHIRVCSK